MASTTLMAKRWLALFLAGVVVSTRGPGVSIASLHGYAVGFVIGTAVAWFAITAAIAALFALACRLTLRRSMRHVTATLWIICRR